MIPVSANQGHTFTVDNFPWIASLRSQEPLLGVHNPDLIHYVISTEDDVIEILSPSVKTMDLGSAALRASSSDKSTVLYNSVDRAEVETAFENIIENQRQKSRVWLNQRRLKFAHQIHQ